MTPDSNTDLIQQLYRQVLIFTKLQCYASFIFLIDKCQKCTDWNGKRDRLHHQNTVINVVQHLVLKSLQNAGILIQVGGLLSLLCQEKLPYKMLVQKTVSKTSIVLSVIPLLMSSLSWVCR